MQHYPNLSKFGIFFASSLLQEIAFRSLMGLLPDAAGAARGSPADYLHPSNDDLPAKIVGQIKTN